ncbi:MAG: histidinol dehydrogenase [Sulfobacillus acidophilus]|uniref:Histidinol dehydrogenase n=1 Tax=Sulfobacillus acidophilus TaxID=53633 RepID=A0A2T2WE44_9FIRM|nr:MAG: histidinol dehydrogenase [Sulfobacillus acidophilus]
MTVSEILDDIRDEGVVAALKYTRLYDAIELGQNDLIWHPLLQEPPVIDWEIAEAIDFAIDQIRTFHEQTKPASVVTEPLPGVHLEERYHPLGRVGIYIPNGQFPLISTLLMTAIPARAAGVTEVLAAMSPRDRVFAQPLWTYVFQRLNISDVLLLGGAQAIGALAYGLENFSPVDFIAGPGNRYVAEAKREVARRGLVGIDLYAGPSEVLVIANEMQWLDYVVSDLMAQAEHDRDARAELVTTNPELAEVVRERTRELASDMGMITVTEVETLQDAVRVANDRAPEHLGLMGAEVEALADDIWTAGAIFVGPLAGQAFGDYVAGPSHVLPTGGVGRFQSGLSTRTFMKRISVIQVSPTVSPKPYQHAAVLAHLEGLLRHEQSMRLRQSWLQTHGGTNL